MPAAPTALAPSPAPLEVPPLSLIGWLRAQADRLEGHATWLGESTAGTGEPESPMDDAIVQLQELQDTLQSKLLESILKKLSKAQDEIVAKASTFADVADDLHTKADELEEDEIAELADEEPADLAAEGTS